MAPWVTSIAAEITPHSEAKRVEQFEQTAALVENAQVAIDPEGDPLQQIAERHPEHHAWHKSACEQRIVPEHAPTWIGEFVAEFETDRPQDERCEHEKHRNVKARKRRRVDRRPRREHRAAAENQPNLVAVPKRSDGVDRDATLGIIARHIGQQHRDS